MWPLIYLQFRLLFKWIGTSWAVSQDRLLEGNQHTLDFSFSSSLAVKIIHHNQECGTSDGRACGSMCVLRAVQPGCTPRQSGLSWSQERRLVEICEFVQVHQPQTTVLGLRRDCSLDYSPSVRVITLKGTSGWGSQTWQSSMHWASCVHLSLYKAGIWHWHKN